jgi:hypothetical protein
MTMRTTLKSNEYGRLAREVQPRMDTFSKETADEVLAEAKSRVHVITGATRDSGEVVKTGIGYDVMFSAGAIWEEYGNRFRPPHPFLTPASEAARSGYVEKLRRGLAL